MPKCIAILLALLVNCLPFTALAQVAGSVVAIVQSAQVTSGGAVRNLVEGSEISSGDLIKTNGSGEVQIIFLDETKIVIGRNSELKIDQTLFRSDGTARKFATKALGGTFRFISGKSPKKVYKIATPLATMGIRGTEFDFAVAPNKSTNLLLFRGSVRFCNRDNVCVTVPDGCQAISVGRSGEFSQPQTAAEKAVLLDGLFPLVRDQDRFRPEFRVATNGCLGVNLISLPSDDQNDRSDRSEGDRGNGGTDNNGGNGDPGGNPAE